MWIIVFQQQRQSWEVASQSPTSFKNNQEKVTDTGAHVYFLILLLLFCFILSLTYELFPLFFCLLSVPHRAAVTSKTNMFLHIGFAVNGRCKLYNYAEVVQIHVTFNYDFSFSINDAKAAVVMVTLCLYVSHESSCSHPEMVPSVCRSYRDEKKMHLAHLPVHRILRRTGSD